MKMLNNLYIVCLNKEFGKEVCEKLAKTLVLPFVDCEDFVENDLLSRKVHKSNATTDYLEQQEQLALCNCLLQKGVFLLSFNLVKHNLELFKGKKLSYLRLPQKYSSNKVDLIAFTSRDNFLKKNCEIIEVTSTQVSEIEGIFKSLGV